MALSKEIPNFEGLYKVYSDGRIWSKNRSRFMSAGDNGNGYKYIFLHNKGTKKRIYVHRLIAQLFIPNADNLPQVNHVNGDKGDNSVTNLEWCSLESNMQHAWKNGLCKPHESQKEAAKRNAKLRRVFSDEDVFEIRYLYAMGARFFKIAKEFGVTDNAIRNIINYKTYKEVI